MATFDYSPIADYVILTYRCPNCHNENTSDAMSVPAPDFMAEKASESENYDDYQVVCEHCGDTLDVSLMTRYDGGWGEIYDLDEDDLLDVDEEFPEDDSFDYSSDYFEESTVEYARLLDKIQGLNPAEEKLLFQLLYVNIIARMEAYLGDTFKSMVLTDDDSLRNFVENYKDFDNENVSLSDIYKKLTDLPAYVRGILNDIIYHNLSKVKRLYSTILKIDLGDIGPLCKAVLIRHDIVHRNGKTKDGDEVNITRSDIEKLWKDVSDMIGRVNGQIVNIEL